MPNLRVIHDNAADRATLVASTTAGALAAANMLTDIKGQVHRSTGTSVSYTLTWAEFQSIGGLALPATNLSADATIRVRAYDAASGGNLLADTGLLYACPGPGIEYWDWSLPLNQNAAALAGWSNADGNAFAFGGASKSSVWFDQHVAAKRLVVDLVDAGNLAGFIDCSRLVCGAYWSPTWNASYGVQNDVQDTTKNSRNAAGDNLSDRGPQFDTLRLDVKYMPTEDRARLNAILKGNGLSKPVFLSLVPESADALLEQDMQIYAKRLPGGLVYEIFNAHSTQISLEGW